MEPALLEQFAEFSGIRGDKLVDEEFLRFLSRVNPRNVTPALKKRLFADILAYHQRHLQWIKAEIASSLPGLFDLSLEQYLITEVTGAEHEKGAARFVRLSNVVAIVGEILNADVGLDRGYWRQKLLEFAAQPDEHPVLVRTSLFALEQLGDASVIEVLPATLLNQDVGIGKTFLRMCRGLSPESPVSVQYFIRATARGEIDARYGLYALKSKASLKAFLEGFKDQSDFRRAFLEHSTTFSDRDREIVDNILAACDDELAGLGEDGLIASLHWQTAHNAARSPFVLGLCKVLHQRDPTFLSRIIERVRASQPNETLYYAEPLFTAIVETPEDLARVIAALMSANAESTAFGVVLCLRSDAAARGHEFFEAAKAFLPQEYEHWKGNQRASAERAIAQQRAVVEEFRRKLEPEPGRYDTGVFSFFVKNADELEPTLSTTDRKRLETLIVGSVFLNVNPADYELTITEEHPGGGTTFTMSSAVGLFRDAFLAAKRLGLGVTPFRKAIISYIPFAWSDELHSIFELVGNVTSTEFAPVISVYKEHKSDLWRHLPGSFIEAVERYHIVDAIPVLRSFVKEPALDPYTRERALNVSESFAPDRSFLASIASEYEGSASPQDTAVGEAAARLLITNHADAEAIRKRLRVVIDRAEPFILPRGPHAVGQLEEEITVGKGFAGPLMQLRDPGYQQEYIELIDHSIALWQRGLEFQQYAAYLWDIVYAYFNNLKESGSYAPLQSLERKIATIKEQEGANWLAARLVGLRRAYLSFLGKPKSIAEAIRQYNDAKRYTKKAIVNSQDLAQHLKEAIENDLARWIESEGAYDVLQTERLVGGKQQYEKLVQKTLKGQLENVLLKRGFQPDVYREPQLLDDKRPDMLVRYGFAGPVIIEIKLTSNKDLRTTKPEQSASCLNLKQYLDGFGASHGIVLVFDNKHTRNLQKAVEAFGRIPNVWVRVFDCHGKGGGAKRSLQKQKKAPG